MNQTSTEPIEEKVNEDLFLAVCGVNTANGYFYDLVAERVQEPENSKDHLKAVVVDTSPGRKSGVQSQGRTTIEKDFAVETYFYTDKEDPTPLGKHLARINADITRAVMKDPRRGGYAIKTITIDPELIANEDGAIIGISVNFTVTFRYKTSDPSRL
jgi:hypothetical protein